MESSCSCTASSAPGQSTGNKTETLKVMLAPPAGFTLTCITSIMFTMCLHSADKWTSNN